MCTKTILPYRLARIPLLVAAALASATAFALPTDPVVASGSASFSQSGGNLTIINSPNAIINWGSFSIGAGEAARFLQQNPGSAVLNRVIGQDPSLILGQLSSNGRVFLINPNGILFGAGSRVDVAGLVASTLKMTDADFLAGRMRFTGDGSEKGIDNRGSITTGTGGSVYLFAPDVTNNGLITAPGGDVLLAAGRSIEIADATNPALRVILSAPEGKAVNIGQVVAEGGRIGMHGALVSNSGTLNASSAVAEGGKIYLRATERIDLTETSQVLADGTKGGEITAIVSRDGILSGELYAAGRVSATGDGTTGSGGFLETSAAKVRVGNLSVETNGGHYLIDPNDFTIADAGDIDGATLEGFLNGGTNVTILSSQGAPSTFGFGDINAIDPLSWNRSNLTLIAARNIIFSDDVVVSGSAQLTLRPGTANGLDAAVAGSKVDFGNLLSIAGGTVNLLNGTANILSGFNFSGGLLNIAAGTRFNLGSGVLNVSGSIVNNGTLSSSSTMVLGTGATYGGTGTYIGDLSNTGGNFSPGNSPGVTTITGNYVQGPSGTLTMELGGTTQGTQYDFLDVSGTATLGGTLIISLFGGFTPRLGNSFSLIDASGGISGTFATINVPTGYTFKSNYSVTEFWMDVTGIPAVVSALGNLTTAVNSSLAFVDGSLNLAAPSYQTPLLIASGESITTACSDGVIADVSRTVIPADLPETGSQPQADAGNGRLIRIGDELSRQSNLQDAANESRLICR